ncbi:MAG: RnfABCDGE type electron transport complex subunit D [Oscillospiraceae bacterium]|nr:RnfABCDGE type electron transport complex subunit D [Oscillospiraceae bacterium]
MNNIPESESRKTALFERKPRHIYADQLLCLLVLLGMAVLKSGTRALGLAAFAVMSAVIVDWLCCRLSKKGYTFADLSTISTGLCLALMSPAVLPYSFIVFGSSLAIGVKHIFGGKDNYIFNPTAVAFAFLIICYPGRVLAFPAVGETQSLFPLWAESLFTRADSIEFLLLRMGSFPPIAPVDFLIGNFVGPIGTTHVLIILVSAVCLLFRRSISPVVTIACLSVITIFRLLFPIYDDIIGGLGREIFGGYLFFALIFLANDPQTVPKTIFGRLYYGILLGVFTIIFRGANDGLMRGKVEGWFIFAILASNTFSCRMDIIAAKNRDFVYKIADYLNEKLTAYERFSEDAKKGNTPNLFDTQEIEIEPSNYDMPPIDNKIIKVRRKKRNVLAFVIEITRSLLNKLKRPRQNLPPPINTSSGGVSGTSTTPPKTPPFFLAAFAALFESMKKPFDILLAKPAETSPVPMIAMESITAEPAEEDEVEVENTAEMKITDFEEIAADCAEFEAELDEQLIIDN